MTTAAPGTVVEMQPLRLMAQMIHAVVRMNTDGVSHGESLARPHPGGNCLNWVVGHLACVGNKVLGLLGQPPVADEAVLARYDRGSALLTDPAEAMDFGELLALWDEACARLDAGLATLTPEVLDQKAPSSPTGNPDETMRSLVTTVVFHQAYHCGQTGVLRRISGKEGAVR